MRRLTSVLLLAILIFTGFSCKNKKVVSDDALTLKKASIKTRIYVNDDTTRQYLDMDASLEYPTAYNNAQILAKVQKIVLADYFPECDSLMTVPEKVLESYVANYKKFFFDSETAIAEESSDSEDYSEMPWTNTQSVKVRFNEKGLFSYTVCSDRFTGGAHGGKNFINSVIDLKTGEKITVEDLFSESSRQLIVSMIVEKIKGMHKVADIKDLEDIGFFDLSDLELNNFFVDSKGITYTFNEYEIAAYAVGTTDVTLSFEEISDLLKPGNALEKINF
jgi:hypothetical protein